MNTTNKSLLNRLWELILSMTFWKTVLFSLLVFIVFSIVQTIGIFGHIYTINPDVLSILSNASNNPEELERLTNQYAYNGDAIAIGEIPAAIVGVLLILWFSSMNKANGIEEYLALYAPKLQSFLFFLGLLIVAMITMEGIGYLMDRETPEFMTKVYSSATNLPLLWLAVVVAAPFFEEFLFRGYLLEGLSLSPLGITGAILITSAVWAVIHMQYGWFEITSIFFIGILLAIAKIKSKSLYVPIAMHMLMNLAASIAMEFTS